jgi:hypothetical protein
MDEAISDPTGFQAILTDDCWRHIVSRHPEMEPLKQFVVEAIGRPDGIYLGKRDPARRIYRKRHLQVPGSGIHLTSWSLSAVRMDMLQRPTLQRIRYAHWEL